MDSVTSISCIICTRNRAESLRETLECLAVTDVTGFNCEVVVVDNASDDHTREVAESFGKRIPIRYLYEQTISEGGKGISLNHAVDAGGLGEIVALLDDDMSVEPNWFQVIAAAAKRWPETDLFTGRSYIVWPVEDVPDWVHEPGIRGWAYSTFDSGTEERSLEKGRFFSGNHMWFRSRVLKFGHRFLPTRGAEAAFQMDLQEHGCKGMFTPDTKTAHRVQSKLLDFETMSRRAVQTGKQFAITRMVPFRPGVNVAAKFNRYPLLVRLYSLAAMISWQFRCMGAMLFKKRGVQLVATHKKVYYRELLRIAANSPDYRIQWLPF